MQWTHCWMLQASWLGRSLEQYAPCVPSAMLCHDAGLTQRYLITSHTGQVAGAWGICSSMTQVLYKHGTCDDWA